MTVRRRAPRVSRVSVSPVPLDGWGGLGGERVVCGQQGGVLIPTPEQLQWSPARWPGTGSYADRASLIRLSSCNGARLDGRVLFVVRLDRPPMPAVLLWSPARWPGAAFLSRAYDGA